MGMMTVQEAISCLEGVLCGAELLETDVDDITDLLREQEAVEPKWIDFEDSFTGEKFKVPKCGACESLLLSDALYCFRCGRKVKWDAGN